jgi:hypothetical protein
MLPPHIHIEVRHLHSGVSLLPFSGCGNWDPWRFIQDELIASKRSSSPVGVVVVVVIFIVIVVLLSL